MNLNEPSRKIPKNYRNITGKFSSKKSSNLVSFESKLERDFLYLFEFDTNILKILEQPITIKYTKEDKTNKYTPDFYLKTSDKYNDIIIEVKYYNELKNTFLESKEKYKAMVKYCKEKNIDFKFYTDRCPYIQSEHYRFNLHFLLNYYDISQSHYKYISNIFKPYITVQEILNSFSNNKFEQLELLNTIWALIRHQILVVDLYIKLSIETKLISVCKRKII